ncbi:lytic transglycosylase domain-containing protein [Agromyces sp. Marseille-P2726]|uniref:aggregation-promoting factor C-terminal-like domain-containing protein n=1 Tax=Agromyces sp. Marseille-P2726 TaxID=2709132 RepID=UPI0020C38ACC|nr:lytic transglycosylase domain-containing protein [Agromyces sp. Marseille-P2726]
MQNQPSFNSPAIEETQPQPWRRRAKHVRKGWRRGPVLAAGAVTAIGAMVGTGFVVQGAVAAQNDRIAETQVLSEAANRDILQLDAHGGVLEARAVKKAEDTLAVSTTTIAAAQGKADAGQLAASAAALADYKLLAPERVFALVEETTAHAVTVQAAVAEADRIAAEQAAAAAAAAQAAAEAAAKAAAEAQTDRSSSSSGSRPGAPANPSEAQAIARDMMASQYGWGEDQFGCLVALWNKESGWNVYAENRSSGAYGIPQALPGSKMASAGSDWQTNPATQISWGLGYIAGRYGTPCAAWDTSERQGWY